MMIASSSLDNHVHNVIKQRSDRKISYENNNSSNNNNFTERISSFSSTKRKKRNNCCFCRTITNYSSQSSSEITKMSFFEYLFSFITIINVLLLLFILQGLFGLSSSFILLYTTGDSVLENTRQFQQFQVQLFINHQLTDFIETTSLMAEHLKYQLRYLPLNLRDDIAWIRLFQYYFNIYSNPVSSVYFSKRNDEFIMLTKEEDNSYSLKINNATNYLVWRKLNLTEQIGDDYFETREIFQRDNIPFFPTSRTWFKFYFEKNNTFPRWADLFINFRGELAFTLTMPVYVNETVTNNTFIESPIYEDKSNPGPTSLYGIIGIQISLKIINDFLNRTFSGDLDFVMIINSKSDVIAVSSQHARNDSGLVEGLALKEIKELDLLTWIVHPHANNNDNAISIGNGTHFVLSGDSFGVIDVQFTVITDNYGLDWAVVIGVPTKSFGDEIFGGSGVISLVVFIIVFILGMTILFIIVKVISIPLQRIYKRMVDLVRFKGIRKHENNRLSIFYDVRNMQRSIKAMKRGIRTFSRYVPEIIVKHSMNSKEDSEYGKIGMALRHMSVMFSDITDFTLLVEKTDTTTFLTVMTEYFSGMCQVIENHQGLVDKFIGDAVMGFFNERSFPIVNHEIQACHAALDSFNVLQELNSKWKLCGYPEIDIHIVINSGNMLCGNIGAENRMNFTVVGDTVNIASRLEVLNKTFNERILISKDTYEKVKDKFICYFVDYVVLKGNDKGIAIYSVICDIKDATELQIELCKSLEMICKLLISFEFKKMTEMCKTLYEKSNCKIVEHLLNRSISLQHLKETLPEITMKDIAFSLKNEE